MGDPPEPATEGEAGHAQGPEHERAGSPAADRQGAEHGRDPGTEAAPLAVTQETAAQEVKPPAHGRRGTTQGARGCWALNSRDEPCAAPKVLDGDYCSAHMGLGISRDPAAWSKVGGQALAAKSAQRAELRLALGLDRRYSPRAALKAATAQKAGEIAGRVVDACIDPKLDPLRAADLSLRLIDAVDPMVSVSIETEMPATPEGLETLGLASLEALARSEGIIDQAP